MAGPHTAPGKIGIDGADSAPRSDAAGPSWRIVNIATPERIGRVVIGLAGIIVGLVLIAGAGSAIAVVLEVLLIAAGLDLAVTGALGHCPLYQKLGYLPRSLREPR